MNSSSFSGSQYGRGGQPQGGFFASQSGHDDQMDSSQGKGSQRSAVDPRTLLPVTLRQLITAETSATEDAFRIDGKETGQVTAIGVAIEVSAQATFLSFTLDDGTGRLSCRMFYDETTKADVYEGSYIRIFGKLRSHAGQRSLIVIKISPVEDHNEITFHILEAIQVHCYNQNLLVSKLSNRKANNQDLINHAIERIYEVTFSFEFRCLPIPRRMHIIQKMPSFNRNHCLTMIEERIFYLCLIDSTTLMQNASNLLL
eukprot:TRINITY_DN3248_c0_g1_i2.p1 TRINITY_DN3248_c0_g1~~TRINITY_DN3248_c0_g1_i2.p1  ORF type:complete len:257 (+),score=43.59 TRINITY_DN3248_c0_g1_i2:56-826(+)